MNADAVCAHFSRELANSSECKMIQDIVLLAGIFILVFAIRAFLIVLGVLKDPVLASFEQYGYEAVYSPILSMILWGGAVMVYTLLLLAPSSSFYILVLAVACLLMALYPQVREFVYRKPERFRSYPRWYAALVQRTSREERRRLAYLWLSLPMRTRLLYSVNDHYFDQWVDLVLMTMT